MKYSDMIDEDFLAKLPAIEGSGFIERAPLTRALPPDYRRDVLYEAVLYDVGHSNSGDRITVPRGFITNYGSIPRILHPILPPRGRYSGPTILHDYGYVVQNRTRGEVDWIFWESMGVVGVGVITRCILYTGVRSGGWVGWYSRRFKTWLTKNKHQNLAMFIRHTWSRFMTEIQLHLTLIWGAGPTWLKSVGWLELILQRLGVKKDR